MDKIDTGRGCDSERQRERERERERDGWKRDQRTALSVALEAQQP